MAKKVRVGIIGLGWPGREHLKGYKQGRDAEVVALCDQNGELATEQAAEHDVPTSFPTTSRCSKRSSWTR